MLLSQISLAPAEWIALFIATGGASWCVGKILFDLGSIRKGLELKIKSHDKRITTCEDGVKENRESVIRIEAKAEEG